jgi:hypothetical protein
MVAVTGNEGSPDPDGLLYHYASLEACIGIVENKLLWATHIAYMNDTSEQELMWELVRRRVDERLQLATESERPLLAEWKKGLGREKYPLYVSCFSEDGGDRLSQWRAYGGISGVCMGFRKSALKQFCATTSIPAYVSLCQIKYVSPDGDEQTRRRVDQVIDQGVGVGEQYRRILVSYPGAQFKHLAFEEEKEWRLLMPVPQNLTHRIRGSLLIPYGELVLGDCLAELLQTIIVGPSNHKEQTAKAISGMLKKNSLSSVEVRRSVIPYRGF